MTRTFILATIITLSYVYPAFCQPEKISKYREVGLPFVQNYDEDEIESWGMLQDQQGFMYILKNLEIREYNGISYTKMESNTGGQLNAIAIDEDDNRIYIGGIEDFGYLAVDQQDERESYLTFVSLRNYVPEAFRNFAAIVKIHITKNYIYLITNSAEQRSYVYRLLKQSEYTPDQIEPEDSIYVWSSNSDHNLLRVGDQMFIQERGVGLKQIIGDSTVLAPGGEHFSTNLIRLFIPLNDPEKDSTLQILTNTTPGELVIYHEGKISPFPVEAQLLSYLRKNEVEYALKLSNGHIAIATTNDAVLILDQKGRWLQNLNKETGLKSEQINLMHEDKQRGLWLATQKGVSRAEVLSPMTHYLESFGYPGEIWSFSFVKHDGVPYVITENDLLYLSIPDNMEQLPSFEIISEGIFGKYLLSVEETLLLGASTGIYQIINQKVVPLTLDFPELDFMYHSPFDSSLIFLGSGSYTPLGIMKKQAGEWHYIGNFNLTVNGGYNMIEEAPGKLWIGTDINGVLQANIPEDSWRLIHAWKKGDKKLENIPIHSKQYTTADGLHEGWVEVKSIADRIMFAGSQGVQRFADSIEYFVPEISFGIPQIDPDDILVDLKEDGLGNIYLFTKKKTDDTPPVAREVLLSKQDKDGNWKLNFTSLNRMPASFLGNYLYFYPDPDYPEVIWLCGKDGTIRYDTSLEVEENDQTDFSVLVGLEARINDSTLSYQLFPRENTILNSTQNTPPIILDYDTRYLEFTYFSLIYDDLNENSYQVFLEGYDEQWSDWTAETTKEYTRLSEGDYTFRVRARNVYHQLSHERMFAFTIQPPWYRSWWAYMTYGILFILFVGVVAYFYSKWRVAQLELRNRQLEQAVIERTEEIRERNEEIQTKNIQLEETLDNLQRTQQQLILQEKMASLGQMTAGIAHEIKNPLNFVNNFAESSVDLADELKEELHKYEKKHEPDDHQLFLEILEDLRGNAVTIHRNGQRADGIVSGMMDHANDNLGEKREINLNAVLKAQTQLALDGYEAKSENFEVAIKQDFEENLSPITVNPQEIGRVIINLVNNACYALEEKFRTAENDFKPEVKISTKQLEDSIEVRIRDNGIGISTEIRDNIFTPFFTTKPTGAGNTGLGLSLGYDIITQGHQGTIICESEEGKFTEFSILIPLDQVIENEA